MKGFIIPD